MCWTIGCSHSIRGKGEENELKQNIYVCMNIGGKQLVANV